MTITHQTVILNQEQIDGVMIPAGRPQDGGGRRPACILALDLSTGAGRGKKKSRPGYCLAEGHDYIESGIIEPKGRRAADRIPQIAEWIQTTIDDEGVDWLVVEEPKGDHGNRYTDRWLGIVVGVAFECARRAGCDFYLIDPSRVKATGLHKAATFEAAQFVGKGTVTPDEADAIGLWQAATVLAWKGESLL